MRDPDELSDADLGGYAEEFKVDPAEAPPAEDRGPGGVTGYIAFVLERPFRHGLLTAAAGALLAGLNLALAFSQMGVYLPPSWSSAAG